MKTRRCLVPDVVCDQILIKLKATDTARDAAILMDGRQVSSVLVVDSKDRLRGIFTVRDVARRVVGGNLDPDRTPLSQVMTKHPKCAAAAESPYNALRLMQDGGFRHLPITDDGTDGGRVVGIVSRKSFFPEEEALLKWEEHLWEHMR